MTTEGNAAAVRLDPILPVAGGRPVVPHQGLYGQRWHPVGLLTVILAHIALVWLLLHPAVHSQATQPLRPLIQWLALPPNDEKLSRQRQASPNWLEQAQAPSGQTHLPRRDRRAAKAPLPITSPSLPATPVTPPAAASTAPAPPATVAAPLEPNTTAPDAAAAPSSAPDLLTGAATRRAIEEAARGLEHDALHPRGPPTEPAPTRTVEQKINRALYRTPAYTEIRTADGELLVKMPDGSCMVNPSAAEIRDQGARIVRWATPDSDARCPR